MKKVKVYVPVELLIKTHDDGEETFELLWNNSNPHRHGAKTVPNPHSISKNKL